MEYLNSNPLVAGGQEKWRDLAENVLQQAKTQGAAAGSVAVNIGSGLSTSVRMGEVDTVSFNRDKSLGLTVYFGNRKGSASTSDLESEAIQSVVQAACDIARASAEDQCFGLADPDLMAYDYPDLDLNHPWDLSPSAAIELAHKCEDMALNSDPLITNSEGSSVSSYQALSLYANTHGFVGSRVSSRHNIQLILVAEQKGQKQRDYYYTTARDQADLESVRQVATKAAKHTLARLGARQLSTRQAPVIFSAEIARGLFAHLLAAVSGHNLYQKSSFLLDHINKQIFPEFVHIHEQPHLLKGLGSAAFDAEGVRTKAKDFVKNGILNSYILGSYSARRLNLQTTANAGGVYNLIVDAQDIDRHELLQMMGTGLLVTELIGQGVDIVTGNYSRGAVGFWVENGEIQYPVEEITIAGNLRDMFADIQAVASDVDKRGNIQSGSVLIKQMMIAGV